MKKTVYLDYAAATPLDPRVEAEMAPFRREVFANPSSAYAMGRAAAAQLENARRRVARVLGAKPAEIIFTSGSTEAVQLGLIGAVRANHGAVVVSAIEHQSVLLAAEAAREVRLAKVSSEGRIELENLDSLTNDETVAVVVQYANSEIGTIQPIIKISEFVKRIRSDRKKRGIKLPLYFFCDAAQAGHLPLAVDRLGVDMMCMGGSKLYGPHGGGFLYVRSGTNVAPLVAGDGREGGLRPGTENVEAAVGLAAALELMQAERKTESARQSDLKLGLRQEMTGRFPGIRINGPENGSPGIMNFTLEGLSGEDLVAGLDAAGFAVATGSACSAANEEPSHVLRAIGLTPSQAASSLRVSLGRATTKGELKDFVVALAAIVNRLHSQGLVK
jgi:cysteine desulfurase